MKRISIILITAIYLISVSGVSGSNFYCCGKFKKTYFFTHLNANKDCKQDKEAKDCCISKVFFVKVKDNHAPSMQSKGVGADVITLLHPLFSELINLQNIADDTHSSALLHLPPLISKQPVYLTNGVFLI